MLQKIDLSDNTFNVSGAIELSKSLRSLPRMVVLNIGDLNFKDEGIGLFGLTEKARPFATPF